MDTATIHHRSRGRQGDMRIAELSRISGVPVPTIKYYLRENLLPPGELTSPNQASYGEPHLHRLRLIRALVDLGQVPVARVKEVLEGLDSDTMSLHDQIGRAHRAITPQRELTSTTAAREAAAAQVDASDHIPRLVGRTRRPRPHHPDRNDRRPAHPRPGPPGRLPRLLRRRRRKVHRPRGSRRHSRPDQTTPDQIAESVIIGTILGETLISSLRLLAQESISADRWT